MPAFEDLIENIELLFDMPPEDAVNYLISMGYAVPENWEEILIAIQQHCFFVSNVTAADYLQTIHEGLTQAVKEGWTIEQFKKNIKTYLQTKGFNPLSDGTAWRWEVIYRTNIQTAYQMGRFYEMEAAGEEFPYRQYIAVRDIRTTEGCKELNGAVFLHTDPFYLQNQTPRHFNCRATWIALPKSEKVKLKTGYDFPNIQPAKGFGTSPLQKKWTPDLSKYSPAIQSKLKEMISKGIPKE